MGKSCAVSRRNRPAARFILSSIQAPFPMKKNDEFYIGYLPKAPKGIARILTITVGVLAVIVLASAWVITRFEKDFSNSQFEYGTLTELEGVLYQQPVPMLRIYTGQDAQGQALYKSVLLVNFLKIGADNLLAAYAKKGVVEGQSIIKLRGTLIYYDGVTMMELTEKENALIEVKEAIQATAPRPQVSQGEVLLQGEIIDPKCYFGAMKHGEGKPHRDCAIRCISGGIPPVLVVKNQQGETNYMLLTNEKGEPINQEILPYVGLPVEVKGRLEKIDEWWVLKINPKEVVELR